MESGVFSPDPRGRPPDPIVTFNRKTLSTEPGNLLYPTAPNFSRNDF